ncbi:LysM peptidoglycan-binding domain-containing protein [Litchfieldia alkalitelluris]|uniref:LysM peptidoglycan-binding domain-containing protein n=1 Tax=Litchfieldia alkalitelluris TaxID=304268 RepID=UPI00099776F9|nr:LysM peptidoglycan-binding domain-containing protein [Litchfieldia alkalitelluris]
MSDKNDNYKELTQEEFDQLDGQENHLPPRSDLHNTKKKRTIFKIKYPIVRLLGLFFILLILTIFSSTLYLKNQSSSDKANSEILNPNVEKINYAQKTSDDEKKVENEVITNATSESMEEEKEDTGNEEEKDTNTVNEEEHKTDDPSKVKKETESTDTNQESVVSEPEVNREIEYEVKYHTVKEKENLYRISLLYYKSRDGESLIKKWNNLNGTEVYVGQVLKIPIQIDEKK